MIFDAVVLAAVLISAVIAFLRGFIRECLTIVGVAGGLAAAYFGGPFLTPAMHGWLGVPEDKEKIEKLFNAVPMNIVADVLSYALIFIVVVVVLSVLSHFLAAGAKAIGLGPVDRILGIVFGVARAVLLVCLLYLPVYLVTEVEERSEWPGLSDSYAWPHIETVTGWFAGMLPENTMVTVEESTREAADKAQKAGKRLQEGEVLGNGVDKAGAVFESLKGAGPGPDVPVTESDDTTGYKPEQRESLDQLIEDTGIPAGQE